MNRAQQRRAAIRAAEMIAEGRAFHTSHALFAAGGDSRAYRAFMCAADGYLEAHIIGLPRRTARKQRTLSLLIYAETLR